MYFFILTLLHPERPKLYTILALYNFGLSERNRVNRDLKFKCDRLCKYAEKSVIKLCRYVEKLSNIFLVHQLGVRIQREKPLISIFAAFPVVNCWKNLQTLEQILHFYRRRPSFVRDLSSRKANRKSENHKLGTVLCVRIGTPKELGQAWKSWKYLF